MRVHRHRLSDAALAALFLGVAEWAVWVQRSVEGPRAVNAVLLAFVAPPLYWRRHRPAAAVAVAAAAITVQALAIRNAPDGLLYVGPMLVYAYSVGAYATSRQARTALAFVAVALILQTWFDASARTSSAARWAGAFWVPVLAVAWLLGTHVRGRRREAHLLAVAVQRQREQDLAVEQERLRIARELHDILAHTVSLMGIQAGAAERVLAGDPDHARSVLRSIQQSSRESVAELRRLLGILRDGDEPAREPQPRLDQIGELIAQAQAAGLPIELTRVGSAGDLPAGVALSGYRIVQEALTNALKHARPTRVEVSIRHERGRLELEIVNDGVGGGGDGEESLGHGLIGARERVALYGGRLLARREEGGLFRLAATIPLPADAA